MAEEIYQFYQVHKINFRNQSDLIKEFLKQNLNVSCQNLSLEASGILHKEVEQLVCKLKKILSNVKNVKKKDHLVKTVFINYEKRQLLSKLDGNVNSGDLDSSDGGRLEEDDIDGSDTEDDNDMFYKSFGNLTSQKQRFRRTKKILEILNNWVDKEEFPLERLLGFIGYSHCYMTNKKLARIFKDIWNGKDIEVKHDVPLETAIYIKERSLISSRNYTDMRITLKPYVTFPSYNDVSNHIHQIMPELRATNEGIMAKVIDVARHTIVRLPDNVIANLSQKVQNDSSLTFKANFNAGLDGSGGFKVYNSKSFLGSSSNTAHMITVGMSLISIQIDDDSNAVVYAANKACAFQNQRPIGLIPGKETRDNIKDVVSALDIGIFQGRQNENLFDFGSFKARFKIDINMAQIDTKMLKTITGLTGAYCTACTASENEARNKENVTKGFEMNRSIGQVDQLFNELKVLKANGEEFIPKGTRDYEKRQGLCMPPLTKADVCSNITVLHSYLNALTFFERLLYALNSGVRKMSSQFQNIKFTPNEIQALKDAKRRLQTKARNSPLFIKIDTHDSSSNTGTSDTGNLARKFFSYSARKAVLDLIEDTEEDTIENKAKVQDLLQRFSIILRVLSSKSVKIVYSVFQKFCTDTYLAVLQYFDWVHIPGSIHRLLGHCAERIHTNGDYGLGNLSEEGLESCNKMVRKFREHGARKTGLKESLIDVFCHWWVQSDGKIRAASRNYQCHNCFNLEPTRRSEIRPNPSPTINFIENDDDFLFEKFILY